MSTDSVDLELDDDLSSDDNDAPEDPKEGKETAKTNLAKRRVIDNLLEERRLQRQLNDYNFDL